MFDSKYAFACIVATAFAGAASAAPTTFTLNPDHSFARFSYSHMGFSTQVQRFNTTTGTVTLDDAAKSGVVDVTIDMKSIDTGSSKFNTDILSPDFLDAASFPTATFKSTAVKFSGDKPVSVSGNLTIKGITKPVTLTITSFKRAPNMMTKKDSIGADATTTIKRSEFNAGKFAPAVSDDVTISIAVEAGAS